MPAFSLISDPGGTAAAVYRPDRGHPSLYPNSDDETALIVINAHHTVQDAPEQTQEQSGRVRAYRLELIAAYSLGGLPGARSPAARPRSPHTF